MSNKSQLTKDGIPQVSADFQPTLITWFFDNWWKPAYLDHVAAKRGGSIEDCIVHSRRIKSLQYKSFKVIKLPLKQFLHMSIL